MLFCDYKPETKPSVQIMAIQFHCERIFRRLSSTAYVQVPRQTLIIEALGDSL